MNREVERSRERGSQEDEGKERETEETERERSTEDHGRRQVQEDFLRSEGIETPSDTSETCERVVMRPFVECTNRWPEE